MRKRKMKPKTLDLILCAFAIVIGGLIVSGMIQAVFGMVQWGL